MFLFSICLLALVSWMTLNAIWARHNKGRVAHPSRITSSTNPERARSSLCGEMKGILLFLLWEWTLNFFSALVCRKVCSLLLLRDCNSKPDFFKAHCNSILQTAQPFVFEYKGCDIHHTYFSLGEQRKKVIDYSLRAFYLSERSDRIFYITKVGFAILTSLTSYFVGSVASFINTSLKGIVQQKKWNSVIIYSPSCCSKPDLLSSVEHKRRYFENYLSSVYIMYTYVASAKLNVLTTTLQVPMQRLRLSVSYKERLYYSTCIFVSEAVILCRIGHAGGV